MQSQAEKILDLLWKRKSLMTLDHETLAPIIPDPINPEHPMTLPAPSNELENTEMMRSFGEKFSDLIVNASHVAKEVKTLRSEMDILRNALVVANEEARRAIEERDQARRERDEAKREEEMAKGAYEHVVEERDNAKNALNNLHLIHNALADDMARAKKEMDFQRDELTRVNNLLDIANREREEWRTKWEHELNRADLNNLDKIDAEEKVSLQAQTIARLEQDIFNLRGAVDCDAITIRGLRDELSTLHDDLMNNSLQISTLSERNHILESANKNVLENNQTLLDKVNAARRALD